VAGSSLPSTQKLDDRYPKAGVLTLKLAVLLLQASLCRLRLSEVISLRLLDMDQVAHLDEL
jgi:hypothetical protein